MPTPIYLQREPNPLNEIGPQLLQAMLAMQQNQIQKEQLKLRQQEFKQKQDEAQQQQAETQAQQQQALQALMGMSQQSPGVAAMPQVRSVLGAIGGSVLGAPGRAGGPMQVRPDIGAQLPIAAKSAEQKMRDEALPQVGNEKSVGEVLANARRAGLDTTTTNNLLKSHVERVVAEEAMRARERFLQSVPEATRPRVAGAIELGGGDLSGENLQALLQQIYGPNEAEKLKLDLDRSLIAERRAQTAKILAETSLIEDKKVSQEAIANHLGLPFFQGVDYTKAVEDVFATTTVEGRKRVALDFMLQLLKVTDFMGQPVYDIDSATPLVEGAIKRVIGKDPEIQLTEVERHMVQTQALAETLASQLQTQGRKPADIKRQLLDAFSTVPIPPDTLKTVIDRAIARASRR